MTDSIERRKRELIDKSLERRIQMLMQSTSEGIYMLDEQGNVIEADVAFCRHLGYSRTEMLQLSVFDFEAKLIADRVRTDIRQMLNGTATFESVHRRKDGTFVDVEITVKGVKLDGKRRLFCVSHDITERKRVELALNKSESHLTEAQSIAHIGSWDYDSAIKQLTWTEEMYRIFGVSPETFTLTVDTFINLIHPDDQAAMRAWIEACASGQKPPASEFRCVWPDGQIRYIEGQGALLMDGDPAHVHMSGTAQDITERKRAELKLEESENRYKTLFEQTLDYVLVLEPGEKDYPVIADANEAAFEKFGYARSELMGKPVEFLDREAVSIEVISERMGILQSDRLLHFEVEHICKDGSTFWADVAIKCVSIDGKELFYSVERDISDRKRVELALAESMRKLEEKEQAKSRFFASAGHDLRQPLAAANLFIDALKFTEPTERQDKIIQQLDSAMTTFSGLLDALLNVSKLESGVIKPEYTSIRVTNVIQWLGQNFAPMVKQKQLGLRLYFPIKKELVIHSDAGLLNSVLMNLVSNAIKFTTKGAVLISARRRGGKVLFQVWDTGMGVPGERIERIFDEFYQVDNPQRDRSGGLGLGLSIARRSIALLGGKISCRSQVGRGSVFEFCLPLDGKSDEMAKQADAVATQHSLVNNAFARGKRFILVEDDVLVVQAVIVLLEGMGGEVKCFHSAEDALRYADLEYADYYIVDYMLGGKLNGIQFLDSLRQKLGKPANAVLVTGDTSTDFIRKAANCDWPVLYKPINTLKLISSLSAE